MLNALVLNTVMLNVICATQAPGSSRLLCQDLIIVSFFHRSDWCCLASALTPLLVSAHVIALLGPSGVPAFSLGRAGPGQKLAASLRPRCFSSRSGRYHQYRRAVSVKYPIRLILVWLKFHSLQAPLCKQAKRFEPGPQY